MKQAIKLSLFIYLIILLNGCSNNKKNIILKDNNSSYNNIECLIIDYEIARLSMNHDSVISKWNEVVENGVKVIDYYSLLYLKNEINNYYFLAPRTGGQLKETAYKEINSKVKILYLLIALYYNDFDFAMLPILYTNNDCYYNEEEHCFKLNEKLIMYKSSEKNIIRAWEYFIRWRLKYKNKSMEQLRQCERPMPCDLYWLGDTVGLISRNAYIVSGTEHNFYPISEGIFIEPCGR